MKTKKRNGYFRQAMKFLFSINNIIFAAFILLLLFVLTRYIPLNEDQSSVTWIYSSSMQTLAALIALLPISYAYYLNNLDSERNEELDSYIIDKLKKDVYYDMITVIIACLIVIVLNLIGLYFVYSISQALISGFFTIFTIELVAYYVYRLFDPNRVKQVLATFDETTTVDPNQTSISLDIYITKYLDLEVEVKDYISNENDNELVDEMPLYDIVDKYSKDFIDIANNFDTFKEIIFHRNNLIHNYTKTTVDGAKYQKVLDLISLFKKLNNTFISTNVFSTVSSTKSIIDRMLTEYLLEFKSTLENENYLITDMKEDLVSQMHSHFISEYYETRGLDDVHDVDFEIVQNNYSNRKILGVEIKSISPKNIQKISKGFFERLSSRYIFLFLINYEENTRTFSIYYNTKDKMLKHFKVS